MNGWKPATSCGKQRLWAGSLHRCLLNLSEIIIRDIRALGSVEGCGDIVTCYPHAPSVKNLLPQLLGGLLTDSLKTLAPKRDYLSCRELCGPRPCLSWGGSYPRTDGCGNINAWPSWPNSEHLRTTLAL